jgi:hypothetical protein
MLARVFRDARAASEWIYAGFLNRLTKWWRVLGGWPAHGHRGRIASLEVSAARQLGLLDQTDDL